MRVYLRNDQATKVLAKLPANQKRGAVIQVLGAGTVWFHVDRAPLENTDSAGVPTAGNSITSANGPQYYQQWNDDMWMRSSALGVTAEVSPLTDRS